MSVCYSMIIICVRISRLLVKFAAQVREKDHREPYKGRALNMLKSIFAVKKEKQVRNKGRSELLWFQDRMPIRQDKSVIRECVERFQVLLSVQRLNVYRSPQHTSMPQLIDADVAGVTIAQASTTEKDFAQYGGNTEAAKAVGKH